MGEGNLAVINQGIAAFIQKRNQTCYYQTTDASSYKFPLFAIHE